MNRREFLKGTAAAGAAAVLMLPSSKKATALVTPEGKMGRMIPTLTIFDAYGGFRRQGITAIAGGTGQCKSSYGSYLCALATFHNPIRTLFLTPFDHSTVLPASQRILSRKGRRGGCIVHSKVTGWVHPRQEYLALERIVDDCRPDLIFDDFGPIDDTRTVKDIHALAFRKNIAYVKTIQTHRTARNDPGFFPAFFGTERLRWMVNYGMLVTNQLRKSDGERKLIVRVIKNRYGPSSVGYVVPISALFG